MRIEKIKVENFRGIKTFEHDFGASNLVCFVGRGNSTKSTLLKAISLCLSPTWSINVTDLDFFNADVENSVKISIVISEVPKKLTEEGKFGLYLQHYNTETGKFEEITEDSENILPTLTINLTVSKNLEPEWFVSSEYSEPKSINARDREMLGAYLISDYTDNHFSWTRGSPLYTLQSTVEGGDEESKERVLDVIRKTRDQVLEIEFNEFKDTIEKIKQSAEGLGGDLTDSIATVDIKDISTRSNVVSLHNENKVPHRMEGKGSKRITSASIQTLLTANGAPLLMDEIEQGLEPNRVKHLIRALESNSKGQVFITTHSREVVEELEASQIFIVKNKGGSVTCSNESSKRFQKLYRACPEAVYAKKVIVCEGSTEIGFMRAYDHWRVKNGKPSLANLNIVYTNGNGTSLFERACAIKDLEMGVIIICDSDESRNPKVQESIKMCKNTCTKAGIRVLDWEEGLDIEQQIFKDFDWGTVIKLITLAKRNKGEGPINDSIRSKITTDIRVSDTVENRGFLAKLAASGSWFKSVGWGEQMGNILLSEINNLDQSSRFKQRFTELEKWTDETAKK